ncbi:MAG: hypothetical protein CMO55_03985 [Verrucomicrobiales bacterium]|nr:hypothetical protein [Verrucomicrobiales bacterium]
MLQIILHRVRNPRNLRAQLLLGCRNMGQTLFQRNRLHIPVVLGMSEGFVDVEKLNVVFVVNVDRLQTGDVSNERGSR